MLGLLVATAWLLSLDSVTQAKSIYPVTGMLILAGIVTVTFAVRRYQRLDELSQRIHLIALAVGFVGTVVIVAGWALIATLAWTERSEFLHRWLLPQPHRSPSVYLLVTMPSLYLAGWVWGRARYR
jgi:uncharacterized membrane protein